MQYSATHEAVRRRGSTRFHHLLVGHKNVVLRACSGVEFHTC
jgi:hypothetical protein